MDKKTVMKWVIGALARGLAYVFAAGLGLAASEAEGPATAAAEAIAALVLVGISLYSSARGRQKLQTEEPSK